MQIFKKVIYIFLFAGLLRIIPGCCKCDDSTMPFSFNKIDILNLDNSGDWAMTTGSDTMAAEAVAFEVALFDSLGFSYAQEPSINLAGFGYASAFSCGCNIPYKANQYLTTISITTLYALTPEIAAGSDVSGLFVSRLTNNSSSGSSLYSSLESVCSQTNGKTYYDSGNESFGLYLKTGVENTQARFVITTVYSDNRILSDTTNLIHIRNR